MTRKEQRIVERDVETLYSIKAFILKPTREDLERNGLPQFIKVNRKTIFLSEKGIATLTRLTDLIGNRSVLAGIASRNEIYSEILRRYSNWLNKQLQP
ncbi:MAG: hypothetical protein QOK03_2050, partial [Candidatus Binataceae bacterium]|nr:hypothetical protein [Candidatus Binataceae bacterium]